MSIFNTSIGFGAYANTGLGVTANDDNWDDYFKNTTTETAEDSLKMQAQMALDAGMTKEELKLDPEWAAQMLALEKGKGRDTSSKSTLTDTQKLAIGGAVLGGILVVIFALKS